MKLWILLKEIRVRTGTSQLMASFNATNLAFKEELSEAAHWSLTRRILALMSCPHRSTGLRRSLRAVMLWPTCTASSADQDTSPG